MTINTKILQLAAQAHRDVDAYATADLLRDAAGEIDAQTAEIARLKAAQTWYPINTAPQGQIALFYDANATEVRGCMFVDWMVDGAFCGNRHHVATHWMPLPAAPSALSGGAS